MKNQLLSLLLILGGFTAYGQVGIGTPLPNSSSQLDVMASDKGILIPRVDLENTTSIRSFVKTNGSLPQSLLVFNQKVAGTAPFNVTPGYYYWFNGKWNRIVISDEITSSEGTVIFNPNTNIFTYIDQNGNPLVINIQDIVRANETLTSLDYDKNTHTLTYKAESGPAKEFKLKELVGDATSVSNTLNGSNLTTTVNGVTGDPVDLATAIVNTNVLSSSGNTITSTVNGTERTALAVNSNTTSLDGSKLTTTVNGVASDALDLQSA
ncbi:hypothetical protein LPB87_18385, partial [Flavobacterium sp. EDS]|nr:hypothetical protein [Flavobacterium sp. EDS]